MAVTRRSAVLVAIVLALAGCGKPTERVALSTNQEVTVSVVTRFEGVTLYRVEADGKYIYVARTGAAAGEALNTTTVWTETRCASTGKVTHCHQEPRERTVLAAARQ